MSRTADRQMQELPVRTLMLEADADRFEMGLADLNERMAKVLWALLGILVSTTTAAVLLALNLAVGKG